MKVTILLLLVQIVSSRADYWTERNVFIAAEKSQIVGSNLVLTSMEEQANEILMRFKTAEFDAGFNEPSTFIAARHFFEAKPDIEKSEVFKIINILPKGASLHSHDTALVSGEYLYNLTYRENLYGCLGENGRLVLKFFSQPDGTCSWKSLETWRNSSAGFDEMLQAQLGIIVDDPHYAYPDINAVWNAFISTFGTITPMLTYRPVWKDYFYQVLKELYEDNVMYIEFRTTLPDCYDLNGTIYGPVDVAGFYKEVVDQFMLDYPDFQGARFIYAPSRGVDNATVDYYVQTTLALREAHGDFLAGFDLVGQEDLGQPLEKFINQMLQLKAAGIKLFFHAGETNWWGSSTDFNLVDAVLLGTTRIGHGYALMKHPEVLRLAKVNGIAIEVNPISNQVLKLVEDLRNHPANYFIANGYPVVICNDDPSFWGARALSYDWYLAFIGMTSRNTDLKFLKQLALNSYTYNTMSAEEKAVALEKWQVRWDNFISTVVSNYVK